MAFRKRKNEGVVIKPIELAVPTNAKEIYQAGDTKIAITDKYELLQPPVPENFEILLEEVIIKFSSIDETGDPEERLLRAFLEVATKRGFSSQEASSAWYHVRNACLYFGKLSPMFLDVHVEDISCSGPNIPIYVYHQRYGFIPSNISFDASELKRFIHSLAQKSGFILSSDNPIIDATLPDGSRVNIAQRSPGVISVIVLDEFFNPVPESVDIRCIQPCTIQYITCTGSSCTNVTAQTSVKLPKGQKVSAVVDPDYSGVTMATVSVNRSAGGPYQLAYLIAK